MTNEFWFEAAGARIFGVASGAGAPIILLHGGLSNHQGIRAWSNVLEERFRVITPDLRASGRSHDPGPPSRDQLADDGSRPRSFMTPP
jgi:pimeloyl-ACP methyl ester carboxylesterase